MPADAKPPLGTRADLEDLLADFYRRAFADPLLGHVFVDVVQMDLDRHLPAIVGFWEKVLFDVGTYDGRVMALHREVHRRVPLTDAHFARWLELWRSAVQEGYAGPVATQAVEHAERMAAVFLRNLTTPRPELPIVSSRGRRSA